MGDIVGSTLKGRYRIDEFVGRGGMAEVYKAYDTRRGYNVAIKVMRDELTEDQEFVSGFQQEAKSLSKLSHENIVRFYSFERLKTMTFLVMDYVEGATLRTLIAEADGPLPRAQVWSIFRQLCQALHYAHEEGIIHRDVKPGNIIVASDGKALISDFGIAKMADTSTLTVHAPGTPAYMSPEQCQGRPVDRRSDVYSLAIVLFQMLTGRRPFVGESEGLPGASVRERIRWEQMNQPPPSPRQLNPDLSDEVERAVLTALSKNPDDRFPTAIAFLEAIPEAQGKIFVPISRPQMEDNPAAQRLYDQAMEAMSATDWTGAIEVLNRILALHGPFYDTMERLTEANRQKHLAELWRQANAANEAENWTEAITLCGEIVALDPGYPGANRLLKEATRSQRLAGLYREGTQALEKKDWAGAIDRLASIVDTDPGYLNSAELLTQAREAKEREERLAELHRRGTTALESARWKEAAALFEEILALAPEDTEATERLAQAQNSYREQIESLRQRVQEARSAGQWSEAVTALQELIGLEPDEETYQEALLEMRVAQARAERLAELRQKGTTALESGRWKEAIAAFEEMVNIDPADVQTMERLAQAQSAYRGLLDSLWRESQEAQAAWRWPEALAALRRLIGIEPDVIIYRQALEELYIAKEQAEKLTDLRQQGLAALEDRRWREAILAFQGMLAVAPDNAEAAALLERASTDYENKVAWLWQRAKDARGNERWQEALDALQELTELVPEEGVYRQALEEARASKTRAEHLIQTYRLGRESLDAGGWKAAIEALDEVVMLEPNYDRGEAAVLLERARREQARTEKAAMFMALTRERLQSGLEAEAVDAARKAVEIAPESAEARDLLAQAENAAQNKEIARLKSAAEKALSNGLWKEALENIQNALQLAPQDETLLRGLQAAQRGADFQTYIEKLEMEADAAWDMKDWSLSAARYTELAGLFPADGGYRSRRDTANRELQRQTRLKRLEAEADKARQEGDWDTASKAYEELVSLVPRETAFVTILAEVKEKALKKSRIESMEATVDKARQESDWATAVAVLEEMVELSPGNFSYRRRLAESRSQVERLNRLRELEKETTAAMKAADWEQAINLCDGLLGLAPGDEKYQSWLTEARESLARKTNLAAQLALAWERLAVRDWDGAVGAARVALELAPDSAEAKALLLEAKAGAQEALVTPRTVSVKLLHTLEGHSDSVFNVAFSPDGEMLASASNDRTICLYRGPDWELLRSLGGHGGPVYSVAFSPDGQLLASGGRDETVRLWNVKTGEELFTFEGHCNPVRCVTFSPDGKLLASGGDGGEVWLWNVPGRKSLRALPGQAQAVQSLVFIPATPGRGTEKVLLASGGGDGSVFLWDVESRELLRSLEGHNKPVLSLATCFSPDFETVALASGSRDGAIRLWDVGSGEMLRLMEEHKDWVFGLAFSPDGRLLASGSWDKTIRLWDVGKGKSLSILEGHKDWVGGVAFCPYGSLFASASWDKTVRVWRVTGE